MTIVGRVVARLSVLPRLLGRRLIELVPVALWLSANLFVFGTHVTYGRNPDMFRQPFEFLFRLYYLEPFLLLILAIVVVGVVLPVQALFRGYVLLLFGVALMAWVHGNFLVWDYGAFDGNAIIFAAHQGKGILEIGLWLLAATGLWRMRRRLYPSLWVLSGSLCLLQALAMAFATSPPARPKAAVPAAVAPPANTNLAVPVRSRPDSIFELSRAGNVIIYISDGMQSDVFAEILSAYPQFTDALDGFISFDDASTNSSSTVGAYPAILTGIPYDGLIGFRDYTDRTVQRDNLGLALYRKGYSVAHVLQSPNLYFQPEHSVSPFIFTQKLAAENSASRTLLDASLFRHSPHFLKPYVFDGRTGVAAKLIGVGATYVNETVWYVDFMKLLQERLLVKETDVPAFRLYHLLNAHPPLSLDEECRFLPLTRSRADYVRTNVCSMKMFVAFLQKLRELGVYDNSHIVFLGDHGTRGEKTGLPRVAHGLSVGDAWPALLIKPAAAHGSLRVSHAQAEVADVAATIAELTGVEARFPGRSLLALPEDEQRERHFFLGKPGERWDKSIDQAPHGAFYAIRGKVIDPASWNVLHSSDG